ncbi:flavodoxin reductase [Sungkyunkwania multivorans]|uniref:Flavodoxin reductase n=1 Tax=Sungkyunkwania multivorans TaxID=1173618 RepID=A0ABW3CXZ4_9FLAO
MEHQILVKKIEWVTHDVVRLLTDKPKEYNFIPGQATELAIDKDGLREQKRPFTFTSLPENSELEFTIKIYESHKGVTDKIQHLRVGDKLIIGDAWGAIQYKGPGTFIAGGAGITPFIAILKDLNRKNMLNGNRLFFGNKTEKDIIYKSNLETWLGDAFYNILSEEEKEEYAQGQIDKEYLKKHNLDASSPVYLCGPPPMMDALIPALYALGISESHLIKEGFE